jgi:epoxyqueuosine reductase
LLGVLLLSIPFPPDEPEPMASCGACRRCLDACPTDAFVGAYRLDATRCISYLTIEQREAIPEEFAGAMDGWAFGCDVCQEVCPFNDAPLARRLPELAAERGIGPTIGAEELARIDSGKAYLRKWGHTPLERAGWKGMRRNIEAALGAGAKGREAK